MTAAIRSIPRLADVARLGLDREAERGYLRDIVDTVGVRLDTPFVMVDVLLNTAQVFLAGAGPAPDWMREACGTPAEWALCVPLVADRAPRAVPDLSADPLFHDNPLVTVGGIRAYAGAPLISHTGQVLGGICGLDVRPRLFHPGEMLFLQEMAAEVVERVEERAYRD
ncbi:GAF domain-containing protein [Actinoplanes sp. CA-142083]|uniref:GAF domain-containing protein n=1 Tax=Actinoplanes sp. CA-142083 TaxID=3239903 RepID=UPI003D8C9D8F